MDNDDDFTFCQVGSTAYQDGLPEKNNITSDIGGMTIRDESTNSASSSQSSKLGWEGGFQPVATSMKEETIGSLSFSVIDTSPCQPSESSVQVVSGNPGPSAKRYKDQKLLFKKPAPRSKVPFEKGYSQMDWLKLTRTHPDLAGLNGQSNKRLISMSEVKQHQSEGSMWTVLKGRVYNLSPYMKFHPGGVDMLMKAVGKDCTSLFNKYHAWVNADFLLEKCLVGTLDDAS